MEKQIHGHDVLDFMIASGRTFTRASLATAIVDKFGAAARYHTCSAADMTAGQLVALLASKGKFRGTEAGFTVNTENVCRH